MACPEAATGGVLKEKMFLGISQNSQENTCTRDSFWIKLQISGLQLYYKRDSGIGALLWFLRNFSEQLFYRTSPGDCFYLLHFSAKDNYREKTPSKAYGKYEYEIWAVDILN